VQKRLENVPFQKIKRLHYYVSGQIFAVLTYTDTPHACAAGAFDPGGSVFYDDASLWGYAEPRSRSQIHFRIWFPLAYIFRGDDALKTGGGRQSLKDYIDVRTRRR
jgi:hypothetical protein